MTESTALIAKYFPGLTEECTARLDALGRLYPEWNAKINVISRKDIGNLYVKHILHSLSIAAFLGSLEKGTAFLDMGTGGGLPGIPLAVIYPGCSFHLIDRIGKKIHVAESIANELNLKNVTFQHGDIGECRKKYDYIVSRAVMPLNSLVKLTAKNVVKKPVHANRYAPGIVCLKGGDIVSESEGISFPILEFPINEFFSEDFFDTKKIVYIPV